MDGPIGPVLPGKSLLLKNTGRLHAGELLATGRDRTGFYNIEQNFLTRSTLQHIAAMTIFIFQEKPDQRLRMVASLFGYAARGGCLDSGYRAPRQHPPASIVPSNRCRSSTSDWGAVAYA